MSKDKYLNVMELEAKVFWLFYAKAINKTDGFVTRICRVSESLITRFENDERKPDGISREDILNAVWWAFRQLSKDTDLFK